MKKHYIAPDSEITEIQIESPINGSVANVNGDTGVSLGDPDDDEGVYGNSREGGGWFE